MQAVKENLYEKNEILHRCIDYEDISQNAILTNVSDTRRASDGFCGTKDGQILSAVNKRRHSDGFVQTTEYSNDTILARKRKTLKRQSRISDVDAINYCSLNFCKSDTAQCKELVCNTNKNLRDVCTNSNVSAKLIVNVNETTRIDNGTKKYNVTKCSQTFPKETHNCIGPTDDNLIKEKQDNNECCIEDIQSVGQMYIDEEERSTCCCHSGTKKYWKKMEKIIQENKNLENMVTKSRKEMAEIREMLSSVLSVRLEPGF